MYAELIVLKYPVLRLPYNLLLRICILGFIRETIYLFFQIHAAIHKLVQHIQSGRIPVMSPELYTGIVILILITYICMEKKHLIIPLFTSLHVVCRYQNAVQLAHRSAPGFCYHIFYSVCTSILAVLIKLVYLKISFSELPVTHGQIQFYDRINNLIAHRSHGMCSHQRFSGLTIPLVLIIHLSTDPDKLRTKGFRQILMF